MLIAANFTTSNPRATPKSIGGNKLTVTIPPKGVDQKVSYEYEQQEMAILDFIEMKVELVVVKTDNSDCYIAGFCASETDLSIISVPEYTRKSDAGIKVPAKYRADGHHERFDNDTDSITFIIRLPPRKLVMIGLIVAVDREGNGKYEDYLFDPQLGNGPPALASGAKIYSEGFLIPFSS